MELSLQSSEEKPLRVSEKENLLRTIKELQDTQAMCCSVQNEVLKEELVMEFYNGGSSCPRYTIRVSDGKVNAALIKTYGVLIVPHGRYIP